MAPAPASVRPAAGEDTPYRALDRIEPIDYHARPMTPPFSLSVHARQRMVLRRITAQEIGSVLDNYHTRYQDKKGNDILIGHPGGRRIKVVVARGSSPPFIIR
jgi:Domain of unknown function (DUF4258)